MHFSARRSDPGVVAGAEHGLDRLIVRVQAVPPDDIGWLHRHGGDQILIVLSGRVLIEVAGEHRICGPGELGVAPAGAVHGFRGLDEPASLEVIGEQACGSELLLRDGSFVELHRPGVPWDRPGPAADTASFAGRAAAPMTA